METATGFPWRVERNRSYLLRMELNGKHYNTISERLGIENYDWTHRWFSCQRWAQKMWGSIV